MANTNLQGLRQASVRAVTGTARDYNSDWMQLFIDAGFTVGTFNERFLLWLNDRLGLTYTSLPGAMAAFAAALGVARFSDIGTFDASGGPVVGDGLLLENGSFLLLESGSFLRLE